MTSSLMPEQERGRSPPETTVTMASDEPRPQLPGLGDPPARRSDVATMGTEGSGDVEEAMGARAGPLGDFVLIGAPWGLLLAPTPLSSMKPDEEVSAHPPCPETMPAAAQGEKQCVECGATETPQWRIQPTGQGALCNACRIRLRPAEALREPVHVRVHLPPPATPTTVMREKFPFPAQVMAAPKEKMKQEMKRKRKPWHPRKSSKQCHHCKSAASTRQWSMGPVGRSTLCDACGMRYRQGCLLQEQEYRPAASPKAIDGSPETHIMYGVGGELQMADPSSLDEFLFNGPAAPLLIDDEDLAA